MRRPVLILFAAMFAWSLLAFGKPPEPPVTLLIGSVPAAKVHPGDTLVVTIPITVARGYHVNANPAASDDYIPLEVKLDSTDGIRAGDAVYPKGTVWRLEGTTENLLVYGGDIMVKLRLAVSRSAAAGKRVMKGTLDFQACNNQVCFLPESRPLAVTVEVLATQP
ncbi:MAG TPA: protein-disulfide reductase DsbD domain-containing protein [bacterium]|jgi:hypothetical protein